jgi:hypothetical protein
VIKLKAQTLQDSLVLTVRGMGTMVSKSSGDNELVFRLCLLMDNKTTKQSLREDESEVPDLYLITAPTGEARCWYHQ